MIVTENGWSDRGEIEDNDRIEYLHDHLQQLLDVVLNAESNLKGYTVWSIIDNFEWTSGYTEKFGLYYINMTSPRRERIPKKSSDFMRTVTTTRQIPEIHWIHSRRPHFVTALWIGFEKWVLLLKRFIIRCYLNFMLTTTTISLKWRMVCIFITKFNNKINSNLEVWHFLLIRENTRLDWSTWTKWSHIGRTTNLELCSIHLICSLPCTICPYRSEIQCEKWWYNSSVRVDLIQVLWLTLRMAIVLLAHHSAPL